MRTTPLVLIALLTAGLLLTLHLLQATPSQTAQAETKSLEEAACLKPTELFQGKTAEQWRAKGAEGLAELIEQMQPSISTYIKGKAHPAFVTPESNEELVKAQADLLFIDQVAKQRDAYISKLYWHTDLDEAIKEAERTDKPILSLRMLGQLDEEYSCANSRFFRTVLYADRDVSQFLREKFVLHWQSVRPVPVITIDMGDGRTIKRTITGNSAHYVLDTNGRVIDCIPGLYGAATFERLVSDAHEVAQLVAGMEEKAFTARMQAWHTQRAAAVDKRWSEIAKPQIEFDANQLSIAKGKANEPVLPDALDAGLVAPGKFAVEARLVDVALLRAPSPQEAAGDDALWQRVAQAYANEAKLDTVSKAMMRRKTLTAEEASAVSFGKARVEDPMLAMVRNFESVIALDTARNEHLLHRQIHDWFVAAKGPLDLDELNRRVYAELFLTPDDDPWLGLVPADTYSALDGGGLSN